MSKVTSEVQDSESNPKVTTPSSNTSPRRLKGTATMNYLSESKVASSRDAVKADLVGKITYDDDSEKPTVFNRLGVKHVDEKFVSACATSLTEEKKEYIATLKEVAENAFGTRLEDLEAEEVVDKANDKDKGEKSGNHGSAEEKRMYNPLLELFAHITNFNEATRPPCRTFHRTNGMLKPDEPHTLGFTSASPDITISPCNANASKSKKWRDRDAFGEVKPSTKQGPKPAIVGTIPSIVTQSADYARLFMSARPFMLFCVGILIFGTEFCVGIFDRDGVTFSPIHDMFEDTKIFVRVVRRLACDMTMADIGWDPTVTALSDEETKRLTGKDAYPSAIVSSIGRDRRLWCTIGPPIWSSLSLLGRGTYVWLVREYLPGDDKSLPCLKGDEMIMKTAWRNSGRTPESTIYSSINPPILGLAKFECGGDVMFPIYLEDTGRHPSPITVQNLRSGPQARNVLSDYDSEYPKLPETPILHRLILKTVGRPMWTYTTDLDLLTGFRDALQAHQRLCNAGILIETIQQPEVTMQTSVVRQHRHLSPEPMTRTHTIFGQKVTVKREANITHSIGNNSVHVYALKRAFVHGAKDDVESFIWVLSYCVMRNLYNRASHKNALQDVGPPKDVQVLLSRFRSLFSTAFGETDLDKLAQARSSSSLALVFPQRDTVEQITTRFMSRALISLFKDLKQLIHDNHPNGSMPLTHDSLLEKVNNAITKLEA
ncbi:hypothetical protein BJ912DRAFT_989456 [Pholiota molesta]|nr:hypothetical protein BJ912DRAFT_989456 [Pholiota molesta]